MADTAVFEKAFPYGNDILALPVSDLESSVKWYAQHFGMVEVERRSDPKPTVIMERDGTRVGFSVNGGDSSREGAAITRSRTRLPFLSWLTSMATSSVRRPAGRAGGPFAGRLPAAVEDVYGSPASGSGQGAPASFMRGPARGGQSGSTCGSQLPPPP